MEVGAYFLRVTGGDVGAAEKHQIVDVVAGIGDKAAHCRVSDGLLDQSDGSHVELDHLGDVAHRLALRHAKRFEDARYHFGSDKIVVMECPACSVVPVLGHGFGYVVEQGRPTEPEFIGGGSHVVEHLHGVVEVVFMPASLYNLHSFHRGELRQDVLEQSRSVEQPPADGGAGGEHDFVQFGEDSLTGDNLDALSVAGYGFERGRIDVEIELRGEADGAHHAQRVVGEGYVGVERRADCALAQVVESAETVNEHAHFARVEA